MKFAKDIYELTDILYMPSRLSGIFPLTRKTVGDRYVYESTPVNWKILLPTVGKYDITSSYKNKLIHSKRALQITNHYSQQSLKNTFNNKTNALTPIVTFLAMVFAMTTGATYICYKMVQKRSNHLFDNITNLYILLIDPYISGTITATAMLMRRKKLLILLNHLHNIDIKLKSVGITPPYKLVTVLAWSASVAIPAGLSTWAIEMYVIRRDDVDHLMWRMCFTPCYIMYNYFMTLYSGMLIIIYERFCLVNGMIKSLNDNRSDVALNVLPKIKTLQYLLCEISNELSRYFDIPMLLVSVKIYITTIACVLSFYGMVPHMHSELTVWMSIYWIYFLLCVVIYELINTEVIHFDL